MEEFEIDKLELKVMVRLVKELWLQSNNRIEKIEHIGFHIFEVSKSTNQSRETIMRYFNFLIEKGYLKFVSENPLLCEFTEEGKKIETEKDIQQILKNVP